MWIQPTMNGKYLANIVSEPGVVGPSVISVPGKVETGGSDVQGQPGLWETCLQKLSGAHIKPALMIPYAVWDNEQLVTLPHTVVGVCKCLDDLKHVGTIAQVICTHYIIYVKNWASVDKDSPGIPSFRCYCTLEFLSFSWNIRGITVYGNWQS